MKKLVTTLVLVLLSSIALALPAPKDIEAAVKAGQLSQAESMLHEVIKEKPGSARAHYELGQVFIKEGRFSEGRHELLEAQRIDPSLKFASDPQRFRDLLNRAPGAEPASPAARPDQGSHSAKAPQTELSIPWGYVLLGGGVLAVIWLLARRAASAARPAQATGGGTMAAGAYGGNPANGGNPPYGPSQATPGSGMGGAVLGGLAGMAAGYGLAKALENREEGHSPAPVEDKGFIPLDSPSDDSPFDAGSGSDDSWVTGDSSAGDDNW